MAERTGGIGHFVPWNGGCLFIGSHVQVVPVHAHYAIQIVFGAEPGVGLRASERAEWTRYGGAIVPSRQPHSMDASGLSSNAVIFVEPETREGRAITERWLAGGIAAIPDEIVTSAGRALHQAWRDRRDRQAIESASWDVIRALTGGLEPWAGSDERILRAVAYINANLDRPLTLDQVAAEAFLSPSRFRHLFVEETGMALRPYILWRRLVKVWELVTMGESISAAAHRAGFADAAHLSRTSRRMIGFPPSAFGVALPLPRAEQPVGR